MDDYLRRVLKAKLPKPNPRIANGFAAEQLNHDTRAISMAEEYIDLVMRSTAHGFPESVKYNGYRRCTPAEEFRTMAAYPKGRRKTPTHELSPSDTYMVQYEFEFEGEKIHSHVLLPFVKHGGYIRLKGSKFYISPVLIDLSVSIKGRTVFIPLTGTRLNFERLLYTIVQDDIRIPVPIVHSKIYSIKAEKRKENGSGRILVDPKWTMVHYMLCMFGFYETFQRFLNIRPVVGEVEINPETYPKEEWCIFRSTGMKPSSYSLDGYISSDLRIAVKRSELNDTVLAFIGAVFYVVDHFPQRMCPEYIDSKRLWKTLMGYAIFVDAPTEAKLVEDIDRNLASLDTYIDEKTQKELLMDGLHVNDIYDLFYYVVENMEMLMRNTDQTSMYNKRLTLLRYLLFDIVSRISKIKFDLNAVKKQLTMKDVNRIFSTRLKPELIFNIRSGKDHGEVTTIDTPGDNILFKATTNLVMQNRTTTGNGRGSVQSDASNKLHASIAEVGSYLNQPKSAPFGRSRINLFVNLTPENLIERNPELEEVIDRTQKLIHP